jgi:hypothetical protein
MAACPTPSYPTGCVVNLDRRPAKHSTSMTWRGAEMRLLDRENGRRDPLKSLTF